MKKFMAFTLVSMLSIVTAPAYAAEAWQAFNCQLEDDDKTEADVVAAAKKWLKAARTMKGGEELRVSVHFPVAAASKDSDFKLILIAPSFEAWGTFWDGYDGSPAHKVDKEANEITTCAESRLFDGFEIEVD